MALKCFHYSRVVIGKEIIMLKFSYHLVYNYHINILVINSVVVSIIIAHAILVYESFFVCFFIQLALSKIFQFTLVFSTPGVEYTRMTHFNQKNNNSC